MQLGKFFNKRGLMVLNLFQKMIEQLTKYNKKLLEVEKEAAEEIARFCKMQEEVRLQREMNN